MCIWPVWLNGWVSVYELSGCRFGSRSCHLNILAHIKYYKYCGIQRQLGRRTDYPDMEKSGNKNNTIRIQRNTSFTSRNMKEKYNKGNPWIELSNKTVWKKKCIKLFLKYFHAFFPSPISEKGKDETSRKFGKGVTDFKKKTAKIPEWERKEKTKILRGDFLTFSYHCIWHWFCILVREIFYQR